MTLTSVLVLLAMFIAIFSSFTRNPVTALSIAVVLICLAFLIGGSVIKL